MQYRILLFVLVAAASLISQAFAAECTALHRSWNWIIVRDGDEAVEYSVSSRNPGWRIEPLTDQPSSCSDCGQVQFAPASDRTSLTLQRIRDVALEHGFAPDGGTRPLQLGPLQGKAQRFIRKPAGETPWNWIALEADDNCVQFILLMSGNGPLDQSPFKDPKALADATVVERIARGPVSSFDIRCVKAVMLLDMHDFSSFERWAGVEPAQSLTNPPLPPRSHAEFMRDLQRLEE